MGRTGVEDLGGDEDAGNGGEADGANTLNNRLQERHAKATPWTRVGDKGAGSVEGRGQVEHDSGDSEPVTI